MGQELKTETRLPFQPVQGNERSIKATEPRNGHVYFATDTKKIFCGKDGEFVSMGGNSGIYYGNRILTDDEKYGEQSFFSFLFEEIDGDEIPSPEDLILNVPDGGFYRVLDIENEMISAQRLVIAGGGGGSSSGGVSNEGSLIVNFITEQYSTTATGVEYNIEFNIEAKDSAGDLIQEPGLATWKIGGKTYTQTVYNGYNYFPVDQYLDYTVDSNKIVLVVNMNTGGSTNSIVSKTWYVTAINLRLDWPWNYGVDEYRTEDTFTLNFTPYGNIDCIAHIVFDENYDENVTYFTEYIPANKTGKRYTTNPMPSLPYGSHTCDIYLEAVNGEVPPLDPIRHEITFIKNGSTTILTVPYYSATVSQYDTISIPFLVYNPDKDKCNVSFYVNDVRITGDSYDRNLQYWPYTVSEHGTVILEIKSDDGDAIKTIELVVTPLDLNITEPVAAEFSLKATEFSNNEELRNWNSNNVTLEFSDNFDWKKGGLKFEQKADGSIEKYICVRQGTRMTIKYKLFQKFITGSSGGKNFKFCFKATNCYDYAAQVLSCYDETSQTGLVFDAQKACFKTKSYPNFATQYYENSYIEVETEIWPDVDTTTPGGLDDRYLMFWVDGVPAGVKPYSKGASFTQTSSNTQFIEIGSDDCDVYVYVAKAYERRLTEDEHLNNFILDAPSSAEMVKRYNRNNILDNINNISYEKLVAANPDCHVYLYDIPKMTTSKDDKVDNCGYYELWKENNTLDNPYYKADNARVYVQGTSSAAYGVAGFNLRTDFLKKGTIYNKDGEEVSGWQVSDTAIPIDITCTKVNIASCENANNVVNAEWYNRFQPYHDAHRRKTRSDGKLYRDTMEFNSGVVFVKDNNSVDDIIGKDGKPSLSKYLEANVFSDTADYTKAPYYKMYAIGNMGNDKKNVEVFHDTDNPEACCVEVKDNQNPEHWMSKYVTSAAFNDDYYEFRYPDGNEEASNEMKTAWIDFVNWMASCDPNPQGLSHPNGYTGEELDSPVTFSPYTFTGFTPPGCTGNPTGISLAGTTITEFAKEYTHDTKEYRIAKMLSECEQHLVMDSVVYHYLYITRHTMVDNVAKNTFWSTEDGEHWDLTKNYDNDTSDGNDNTGNLTYTYGLEFGDINPDGKDVFNAQGSVWIVFVDALKEAQEVLYRALADKGAWDASSYLAEFKRHQEAIPERCWIADYMRKYIRPRRLGLDEGTYLNRLEGGRKVHQRAQYENYQEFYMNSKYRAGTSFSQSGALDLRLNSDPNSDWNKENVLPLTFYIDCYPSALIGGNLHISPKRVKRGEEPYELPVGQMLDSPSDGTCYIYGAEMIQSMSGLDKLYPGYAKLGPAHKLRSIEFGSKADGYYNGRLSTLDIGTNEMLQKIQLWNCGNTQNISELVLTNAHQLKELYLSGSAFKTLRLADGAATEVLELNPLSVISMSNLQNLNNITLDSGLKGSITEMTIQNCPALDSYVYDLAKGEYLNKYLLTDFVWIIQNTGSDYDLSEDFTLTNGKVTGIKVLDNLSDANTEPFTGMTTAASLVGKIIIDVPCNINEYDIYNTYIKTYPNLVIEYSNNIGNGYEPAVELIFKKTEDSAEQHYRVLSNGNADGENISTLISASGPTGMAIKTPSREATISEVFTFTGYWIHEGTGTKYYLPSDFDEGAEHPDGAISFEDIKPTSNMTFYPEYVTNPRFYPVRFYDWNGNIVQQETVDDENNVIMVDEWLVAYGTKYDGPMKNYHHRDSSLLNVNERWSFQGWSQNKYGDVAVRDPKYVDLNNLVVTGTVLLHGHYLKENCRQVATKSDYFDFNLSEGELTISVKDEYRNIIEGKITLPAKYENNFIVKIGNFENCNKITNVFLEDGHRYTKVDNDAFRVCYNLETIELGNNITHIGTHAFSGSPRDNNSPQYMKIAFSAFPENLQVIGDYAFYYGGPNIKVVTLPSTLQNIGNWSLAWCSNLMITEFNVDTIAGSAMYGSGTSVPSITIGEKANNIAYSFTSSFDQAFANYGKINRVTINDQSMFYKNIFIPNELTPRAIGIEIDNYEIL